MRRGGGASLKGVGVTVEVANITSEGIRLSTRDGELFLPYQHFPRPDLDIDLTADLSVIWPPT